MEAMLGHKKPSTTINRLRQVDPQFIGTAYAADLDAFTLPTAQAAGEAPEPAPSECAGRIPVKLSKIESASIRGSTRIQHALIPVHGLCKLLV